MWRSLSIANKIWLSLSILIIGYFASMVFGYLNGRKTEERLHAVSEVVFPATRLSQAALTSFDEQVKLYKDAVLMGDTAMLDTAGEQAKEVRQSLKAVTQLKGLSAEATAKIGAVIEELEAFSRSADAVYRAMSGSENGADTGKVTKLAESTQGIRKRLEESSRGFVDQLKAELSSVSADTRIQRNYNMIAFFVVVMGSLVIIGLIINRSIIAPLKKTVHALNEVAQGDLSIRLPAGRDEVGRMGAALNAVMESLGIKAGAASHIAAGDLRQDIRAGSPKDVLGKALEAMIESLNNIVAELNFSAAQVDAGSRQIADSSTALSQGATQQAAAIEEITSSMTEIGSQTKTNAENASQANQLAMAARDAVRNGMSQMEAMVAAMNAISESSNEIGKIIKTIDSIAFQTNLLALNAAVEAARAGAHGKGFAVVAQEVRSLAVRSAQAAQETANLIEKSIGKVADGNQMASRTSEALQKINEGVSRVTVLVGEIATASNEQAQGISQVNQGLGQVDSVTQRNTANAEETSSAAETLSAQAAQVHHLLRRFKLKDQMQSAGAMADQAYEPADDIAGKPGPPQQPAIMDGWGGTAGATPKNRVVSPEQVIALDDGEFGKY
ncbi:MAG: methyl-accepting chemotaxis protein [Thermodesulfobacteriota bacterium]